MFKDSLIASSIRRVLGVNRSVLIGCAITATFVSGVAGAQTALEITCSSGNVCRENSTMLPLKALPRPYSPMYKSTEVKEDNILTANVKPFSPVYVFARENVDFSNPAEPSGWYQVGANVKQPQGWMQAKDLMEWKQALVVSYTHPGASEEDKRNRVLMFDTKDALEKVAAAPDRQELALKIYAQLDERKKPESVISVEPKEFKNIDSNFYILPVIDFKVETQFDEDTRLLQIAAAVPGQRSTPGNETTLANPAYLSETSGPGTPLLEGDIAKKLNVDIVFVMDMTNSMGPYIELTKQAVADIAKTITADPEVSKSVKFGFVGYRDNVNLMPQLEFTAKNFTPELVEDSQFVEIVGSEAKAAEVGSNDYQEEVYAGIKEALNSTQWREGLHFIVIVGDASSHEPNHPQSTTQLDAPSVRSLLDESKTYVAAIHLQDQRANPDWPMAEMQLSAMSKNAEIPEPLLVNVNVENPADFKMAVEIVGGKLGTMIALAKKTGKVDPALIVQGTQTALTSTTSATSVSATTGSAQPNLTSPQHAANPDLDKFSQGVDKAIAAALIDYLGSKEGQPPRDVTAWVMDRDLVDPRKKAMDVRLLISREDLNSLIIAVESVTGAFSRAELSQMKFFESLQSIVTQGTKGENINLEKAQKLSQAKLLPQWIEGLPYKSAIQDMSDEKFEAMTPDQRSDLEKSLTAKLELYKIINEKVDAWVVLNEEDKNDNEGKFHPLKLEDLP